MRIKIARPEDDGRPTALGCHIYAGGFSLGIREAGFRLLGHLEEGPFGADTSRRNLGIPVWEDPRLWRGIARRHRGCSWLYGNPPCSSWSQAGVKIDTSKNVRRWAQEPATDCTRRLFSLIKYAEPTVFTWESVAAAMVNGREFVDERCEEVVSLGYRVYRVLIDGAYCGLPQHRRRFFFVASKVKIPFHRPSMQPLTVREAWTDMEDPGEKSRPPDCVRDILRGMPKGVKGSLTKWWMRDWLGREDEMPRNPRTGLVLGRPGFLNTRVGWDQIAPTITGGSNYYHPDEPRALTVLEQQLLCGYPIDYEFVGPSKFGQVGKAVLPPPARWLALQVKVGLSLGVTASPGVTDRDFLHDPPPPAEGDRRQLPLPLRIIRRAA